MLTGFEKIIGYSHSQEDSSNIWRNYAMVGDVSWISCHIPTPPKKYIVRRDFLIEVQFHLSKCVLAHHFQWYRQQFMFGQNESASHVILWLLITLTENNIPPSESPLPPPDPDSSFCTQASNLVIRLANSPVDAIIFYTRKPAVSP